MMLLTVIEVKNAKPPACDYKLADAKGLHLFVTTAGVKAYLDDGYDPRLIVEQLAVLRRAQRVRRPERADQPNRKQSR